MFQFRLRTLLVGVAASGALLAANTHLSPVVGEFDIEPPWDYGPAAGYVFLRGWPVSPWMFSEHRQMRFHMGAGPFWGVVLFDAAFALVAVYNVMFLTEWGGRGWRKRTRVGEPRAGEVQSSAEERQCAAKRPAELPHRLPLLLGCATVAPPLGMGLAYRDLGLIFLDSFPQWVAAFLALLGLLAVAVYGATRLGRRLV